MPPSIVPTHQPSASFVAYIDESGDEGFRFGHGSSRWFVLSAVLIRKQNDLEQVKLVDAVRNRINDDRPPQRRLPDKKPLHFRDLKHEQRKLFASYIGQAKLKLFTILIYKPDLHSPETFTCDNHLYFYAVRLLIERISWCCRDHVRTNDGDGSVELVFSNRASMDYNALRQYIEYLDARRSDFEYRAMPNIIRPQQITTYTHGRRMGLQLADAVASSFYFAVEPHHLNGLVETSYAKLLLPRVYRHKHQLWGYGIKIMPHQTDQKRKDKAILSEFQI